MAVHFKCILPLLAAYLLMAMSAFSTSSQTAAAPTQSVRRSTDENQPRTVIESLINGLTSVHLYAYEQRTVLHETTTLADFDGSTIIKPANFCALLALQDLLSIVINDTTMDASSDLSSGGDSPSSSEVYAAMLQDLHTLLVKNVQDYCQLIKQQSEDSTTISTTCSQQDIAKLRRDCVIVPSVELLFSIKEQVISDVDSPVQSRPCTWVKERLSDHGVISSRVLSVLQDVLGKNCS